MLKNFKILICAVLKNQVQKSSHVDSSNLDWGNFAHGTAQDLTDRNADTNSWETAFAYNANPVITAAARESNR